MLYRHIVTAFALTIILFSCKQHTPLFKELDPNYTGIHFINEIKEDQELNVLNYEYMYNGGGVGIADFNNDSLPDIYFSANRSSNKLYLNKGNLQFEDITDAAGVNGMGKWSKGVSIVDINNDGKMDIYVCNAVLPDSNARRNILYINQGNDPKTGIPSFTDMAAAYGLDDISNTHMAAFFDYDNDNDLDVFLLINDLDGTYPNEFRPIRKDGSWPNTDKLLENTFDSTLQHPRFHDVSAKAGIRIEGHGLGISIADMNQDGWKDIYISNDYLSNNIFYINNRNGTFSDHCSTILKHTSKNAMGNDIADINNDGLADIIEMDMMPADNYRQKMMYSDISYQTFQNSDRYGYIYQYPRNTLQLNQGKINDTSIAFSEIAYLAGVANTDWSWSPLLADVDNDGYRDLMISNGLPHDMSDLDFMAYRRNPVQAASLDQILSQIPTVKVNNYIFKNDGHLSFQDMSTQWGWTSPTYSAGMAYADLDNDGDLDVVINNTNMKATVMENTLRRKDEENKTHYLSISLKGSPNNINAIGAFVHIFTKDQYQVVENSPYRGYLSTMDPNIHIGLGQHTIIDSIKIDWPSQHTQTIKNIKADQWLTIAENAATPTNYFSASSTPLLENITASSVGEVGFPELDFIDFNIQRLIPHKCTQYGPCIAVGDLNNDGLDDFVTGGSSPFYASIFTQQANGRFTKKTIIHPKYPQMQDDGAICLFDADKDGDLDIYIASGGAENEPQSKPYVDHFYVNDGKGNFKELELDITNNRSSKSCIAANDIDNDGDLDLFIGSGVIPGSYPLPASSMLYRNDTKDGKIAFTDITQTAAPALMQVGLVKSAIWADINKDGSKELALAMEWGGITLFRIQGQKLVKQPTILETSTGWWNTITAVDLDKDGDLDYVAGNYGHNGYLKPSTDRPVKGYMYDFDNNDHQDFILTTFKRTSVTDTSVKEFPVAGRDEFIKEMSALKARFPNYAAYAKADISTLFPMEQTKAALTFTATNFTSCWFENKGNFEFTIHALPLEAQFAPIFGIVAKDLDEDGHIDLVLNGNEFSMAPYLGRNDALNGLVLKGDGKGKFKPLSIAASGFYVKGNGKGLAEVVINGKQCIAAVENTGNLYLYKTRSTTALKK